MSVTINESKEVKLKRESNIMVIDDNFGFKNVIAFTKPSLALENFRINYRDYCLVISDIRMPEMNGFEFARSVSRIKPKIRVLLMTAFDIPDDTLVNMNMKYNNNIGGIIQKPVSPTKLARMAMAQMSK